MILAEEPTTGLVVKSGRITTVVKVAGAASSGGGGGEAEKPFKNTPTAAPAKPDHNGLS
jgi:hypothetical protein